ncbi:MAG: hypothetical protein LBC21_00935 [Oscillospiraceae bacterium]|nr:hypothetical protein [Oscillospiraceae bacterium]
MEIINLDVLPKDGERLAEELEKGNMVAARSAGDFLYIIEREGYFTMFSHSIGAPGGGRRQFPKDDKHRAAIRKIAEMSDSVFLVEFDPSLNIYGVMYSAEEGILSMFPGGGEGGDAEVEFEIPQ